MTPDGKHGRRTFWHVSLVLSTYSLAQLYISLTDLSFASTIAVWAIPASVHWWWDIAAIQGVRLPLWFCILASLGIYFLLFACTLFIGLPESSLLTLGIQATLFAFSMWLVGRVERRLGKPTLQYPVLRANDLADAGVTPPSVADLSATQEQDRYLDRLAAADAGSLTRTVRNSSLRVSLREYALRLPIHLLRPFKQPISLVDGQRRLGSVDRSMMEWCLVAIGWIICSVLVAKVEISATLLIAGDIFIGTAICYVFYFCSQANAGVPPVASSPFLFVLASMSLVRISQGSLLPALCFFGAMAGDTLAGGNESTDAEEFEGNKWQSKPSRGLLSLLILVGLSAVLHTWLPTSINRTDLVAVTIACLGIQLVGSIALNFLTKRDGTRLKWILGVVALTSFVGALSTFAALHILTFVELLSFFLGLCAGYSASIMSNLTTIRVTGRVGSRMLSSIGERMRIVPFVFYQFVVSACCWVVFIQRVDFLPARDITLLGALIPIIFLVFSLRLLPWMWASILLYVARARQRGRKRSWSSSLSYVRRIESLVLPPLCLGPLARKGIDNHELANVLTAISIYQSRTLERVTLVGTLIEVASPENAMIILDWSLIHGFIPEIILAGHKREPLKLAVQLLYGLGGLVDNPYEHRPMIQVKSKGQLRTIEAMKVFSPGAVFERVVAESRDNLKVEAVGSDNIIRLAESLLALSKSETIGLAIACISSISRFLENQVNLEYRISYTKNKEFSLALREVCAFGDARSNAPCGLPDLAWLMAVTTECKTIQRSHGPSLGAYLASYCVRILSDLSRTVCIDRRVTNELGKP